jgi:hypothetical protein
MIIPILIGQEGWGRNYGGSPTMTISPQGGSDLSARRHEREKDKVGHFEEGEPPPCVESRETSTVNIRDPIHIGGKERMSGEVAGG